MSPPTAQPLEALSCTTVARLSTGGDGEMEREELEDVDSSWIVKQRFEHGLCHQCGNRIYDVVDVGGGVGSKRRKSYQSITIAGVVENGRCLLCYPLKLGKRPATRTSDERPATAVHNVNNNEDSGLQSRSVVVTAGKGAVDAPLNKKHSSSRKSQTSSRTMPDGTIHRTSGIHHNNGSIGLNSSGTSAGASRQSNTPSAASPIASRPIKTEEDNEGTRLQPHSQRALSNRGVTCKIKDSDGLEFVGTIEEGTREKGSGKFCHGEGSKVMVYEGEFESGYFHGKGKSHDHGAGCLYQGDFMRGAAHGYGTCRWDQGWEYRGEWQLDKRHGKGSCHQLVDGGEVYEGEWKSDLWDGHGVLSFAGGGKYTGLFRKDKLHGFGTYEFADGSVYRGNFINDLRHGHGEMTYSDGGRYVGEWRDNWRFGKGMLFHRDGTIFKGRFAEDEKDGIGYLHLPDGIVRKEKWEMGRIVS